MNDAQDTKKAFEILLNDIKILIIESCLAIFSSKVPWLGA